MTKNKICLVVMVYNNQDTIVKMLDSLAGFIDHAVIVDNQEGSDDETMEQAHLVLGGQGVPHDLLQYPGAWHSGNKRTWAVQQAKNKCDYLLIMDADNTIAPGANMFTFRDLDKPAYMLMKQMGNIKYPIVSLLRSDLEWKYTGVIHEYAELAGGEPFEQALLPGVVIDEPVKIIGNEPGQRPRTHYYNHALQLECEIFGNKELPLQLQQRYMFYLGQSYYDAGVFDRAVDAYLGRVQMGGWDQEVFYSLYMIARIKNMQNCQPWEVLSAAMRAWNFRPQRLEAAYMAMQILQIEGFNRVAYAIGVEAMLSPCDDLLFVDREIHDTLFPELMSELHEKLNL